MLGELAVAPDGMSAADAEGAVWIADALGNRVLRITEGRVLGEISTGEVGVYACALGGADGRTLFCCTAPGFAEHERRETREAKLVAFEVWPRIGEEGETVDPCEVYLSDHRPVQGQLLAHKMQVRHADGTYGTITIDNVQFGGN